MSIVVFDIGQVLVPEGDRIPRLLTYLTDSGVTVTVDDLLRGYWAHRDDYDLGLPEDEYWPKVLRDAGLDETAYDGVDFEGLGALDGARNSVLVPETEELLFDLRAGGHHIGLLSNAPTSMIKAVRESDWGSQIEVKIFSAEVGVAKPAQRIFEIAEGQLKERYPEYERETTFFFDDRQVNIDGALEFGWDAHLWEGAEEAREVLGLKPSAK
ncbi:HAD family hydrolase [Corynebacterium liangguodongii]|uniref:Haloacid dehalogenase n=1 Tax=Corynebacterium liangguodongii TaxID=2079535 RepID=A0A2S0WCH5_9CORY|nr:HAD family hydrolase [Corynebacterium liangguodongii]AWB83471.1 haloacid dehalogenase [Corynebacterium liangguodongii]PWC00440.1 haloacid dehalogenase [Corynebacterium liangguodongii]